VARYQAVADDALRLNLIRQPVSVSAVRTEVSRSGLEDGEAGKLLARFDPSGKPLAIVNI